MGTDRVVIALLLCGAAIDVHAACEQPPLVQIPPAEEIEDEEQLTADIEAYFVAMQEYVNCIRAELDEAGDDASELYKRVLVQRNNAAVAEAEAVQRWYISRFPDAATPGDAPDPQ